MKKMIFIVPLLVLFAATPHVLAFAQGFVPLAPIQGLTSGATADTTGLANFLNNLYKFLVGIAAVLAVIEIIWGGLEISTQDSISKQGEGKKRIQQAIGGLVLVLAPALVFSIINPSILNLSLNLPKLDTATTPIKSTSSAPTCPNSTQYVLISSGESCNSSSGWSSADAACCTGSASDPMAGTTGTCCSNTNKSAKPGTAIPSDASASGPITLPAY